MVLLHLPLQLLAVLLLKLSQLHLTLLLLLLLLSVYSSHPKRHLASYQGSWVS